MEYLDTGKLSLKKVSNEYIRVTIYTDEEIDNNETPILLKYFNQFEGKVPLLIDKQGRYALSTGVQLTFIEYASSLFSALAFVDVTPIQRKLTNIASFTYFKGLPVKSFSTEAEATDWLHQFGGLPAFTDNMLDE